MPLLLALHSRLSFLLTSCPKRTREEIWHALAAYCCRLSTKGQFRHYLSTRFKAQPALREALLEFKEQLDNSDLPNRVLRAVLDLLRYQRVHPQHYAAAAATHHVVTTDLQHVLKAFTAEERQAVAALWSKGVGEKLSTAAMEGVLKHFNGACRSLVRRYLYFVYNNDHSTSYGDLLADLNAVVTKLATHYEVYLPQYYSQEHFYRSVHRGVINATRNMVKLYSRQSRGSLARIHRARLVRTLSYLSPSSKIYSVVVSAHRKCRRTGPKGTLQTLVLFKSGKTRWVEITALHEDAKAARLARFYRHAANTSPAPAPLISLAPLDLDDFQVVTRSLDAPVQSEGKALTLHHLLHSVPAPAEAKTFLLDLNRCGVSEKFQAFAKVVIGDCKDQVFAKWLHTQQRVDVGTLSPRQLGRYAAAWVGTSLRELRQELASSPGALWSQAEHHTLQVLLAPDLEK